MPVFVILSLKKSHFLTDITYLTYMSCLCVISGTFNPKKKEKQYGTTVSSC